MAAPTVDGTKLNYGPGIIYWAPIGTAAPTNTVVGSVFTDAWPAGWLALGTTEGGSDFSDALTTSNVEVAESMLPVKIVTTGEDTSISFSLAEVNITNFKRARNGGTIATTGATTTLLTTYTPPAIGAEVRSMIGWQSLDDTLRLVCFQCFQSGAIAMPFHKAPEKTVIPCTFSLEMPSTGIPFQEFGAGTVRA